MSKSQLLGFVLLGVVLASPLLAQQQSSTDDAAARRQKIIDELKERKEKRAWLRYFAAGIYAPGQDYSERPEGFRGNPIGLLAQKYADVTKKEVMVSSRVASRIDRTDNVEPTEEALTHAIEALDVRITNVGKETVVLTDAKD